MWEYFLIAGTAAGTAIAFLIIVVPVALCFLIGA